MSVPSINSYNLDAISWTPIYPPSDCQRIEFVTGDTDPLCNLRSNTADANTEIPLYPGTPRIFEVARNAPLFRKADIFIHAKLASGTGTLKVIAH